MDGGVPAFSKNLWKRRQQKVDDLERERREEGKYESPETKQHSFSITKWFLVSCAISTTL